MAGNSISLPPIHVSMLVGAHLYVGFPYELPNTDPNALPAITDLTEVVSLEHIMKRPDGTILDGLPVSITLQSEAMIRASYIFRPQDLNEDTTKRTGPYKGYLRGTLADGTVFETEEAILRVVDRFR